MSDKNSVLAHVAGTKAGAGANELVAAPGAGKRIVVTQFTVQNETAVATTITLSSAATVCWRHLLQNQGDDFGAALPDGREWVLGDNEALNLNLDGANSHGYSVAYYVI